MAIRLKGVDSNSTLHDKGVNKNTADAKYAGTYHMADNPNLYEVQRSNNFEFVVSFTNSDLKKTRGLGSNTSEAIKDDVAQEVIRMSVSQVTIPHFTQDAIEVKRGNSTLKYAGTPKFNDGSITCNDYIGADTKNMLMAWQNQSYDVVTEKVGLASDYKKQASLIEYTPDLQIVRTWTLYGCWITGIDEGSYNSEESGKHQITVNFSYDKATLDN